MGGWSGVAEGQGRKVSRAANRRSMERQGGGKGMPEGEWRAAAAGPEATWLPCHSPRASRVRPRRCNVRARSRSPSACDQRLQQACSAYRATVGALARLACGRTTRRTAALCPHPARLTHLSMNVSISDAASTPLPSKSARSKSCFTLYSSCATKTNSVSSSVPLPSKSSLLKRLPFACACVCTFPCAWCVCVRVRACACTSACARTCTVDGVNGSWLAAAE